MVRKYNNNKHNKLRFMTSHFKKKFMIICVVQLLHDGMDGIVARNNIKKLCFGAFKAERRNKNNNKFKKIKIIEEKNVTNLCLSQVNIAFIEISQQQKVCCRLIPIYLCVSLKKTHHRRCWRFKSNHVAKKIT